MFLDFYQAYPRSKHIWTWTYIPAKEWEDSTLLNIHDVACRNLKVMRIPFLMQTLGWPRISVLKPQCSTSQRSVPLLTRAEGDHVPATLVPQGKDNSWLLQPPGTVNTWPDWQEATVPRVRLPIAQSSCGLQVTEQTRCRLWYFMSPSLQEVGDRLSAQCRPSGVQPKTGQISPLYLNLFL